MGSDKCQERAQKEGSILFHWSISFAVIQERQIHKMPHCPLFVPLWKLTLPSTMETFSALSFSSWTERGFGEAGVSIKEKTQHLKQASYFSHSAKCPRTLGHYTPM